MISFLSNLIRFNTSCFSVPTRFNSHPSHLMQVPKLILNLIKLAITSFFERMPNTYEVTVTLYPSGLPLGSGHLFLFR